MSDTEVVRNDRGQFVQGATGNLNGRPRGSRNKLGQELIDAFYEDFTEHGAAVVAQVRKEQPGLYLTLASRLVPQDVHLTLDAQFVVRAPMVTGDSQAWQAATGIAQIDLEAVEATVEKDAPPASPGPNVIVMPK